MKPKYSQFFTYYMKAQFHDLFIVKERKKDLVFKTKSLGLIVFKKDQPPYKENRDIIISSISTSISREM